MPDLLAHTFIAFSLCVMVSWAVDWMTKPYITVGMAGAFIPDLAKIDLLIDSFVVEQILGVPFDWFALHTAGGALVSILIGGLIVVPTERRRVIGLLGLGAASHLIADALLLTPTGRSYPVLWPLTQWSPPTPGLYLSTQPEPMIVTGVIAVGVWLVSRRVHD